MSTQMTWYILNIGINIWLEKFECSYRRCYSNIHYHNIFLDMQIHNGHKVKGCTINWHCAPWNSIMHGPYIQLTCHFLRLNWLESFLACDQCPQISSIHLIFPKLKYVFNCKQCVKYRYWSAVKWMTSLVTWPLVINGKDRSRNSVEVSF